MTATRIHLAGLAFACAVGVGAPVAMGQMLTLPPKVEEQKDVYLQAEARRMEAARQMGQLRHSTAGEFEPPTQVTGSPEIIYGNDDRQDVYEIAGNAYYMGLQQAAAVVVGINEITYNAGTNTYSLSATAWTQIGGTPVCPTEPFNGQLTIGFCSSFLVGTDLVATAGHCVGPGDEGQIAFIFGFDQQSAAIGPNTTVPADNVYIVTQIVDHQLSGDLDHCVSRVDRPVVGRTPLPIRRSGTLSAGEPVIMIGHPWALPKKLDDGGQCQDPSNPGYFTANVDAYGGNSGSMVVNAATGVIEGILVRGNPDWSFGSCVQSNVCPNTGCPGFEEISKTIAFAGSVPELGLVVGPAGNTTHLGVVGGPFTNTPVGYVLSNPTQGPVSYEVRLVAGGTAPMTINAGTATITGSLAAGGSFNVSAAIGASASSLPQGIYTRTIDFVDVTNGRTASRTHTLEVGTTGMEVTPLAGLEASGPIGGPFTSTQVYSATSTRPTGMQVRASANQNWVSINGSTSPVTQTLTGLGSTANFNASINSAAFALTPGIHTATISIDNLNGGTGSTTRTVVLDVGRLAFTASGLPLSIPDDIFPGIESVIPIGDAYCIADVNVRIDITHTFIGDLIVEIESPLGTVVRLHNRTGANADDIHKLYDDTGAFPPDGPGALADFIGQISAGDWTLRVWDEAGADIGTLDNFQLFIGIATSPCPPVAYNVLANAATTAPVSITLDGQTASGNPLWYVIATLPSQGALQDPVTGPILSAPHTLAGNGDVVKYMAGGGVDRLDGLRVPRAGRAEFVERDGDCFAGLGEHDL